MKVKLLYIILFLLPCTYLSNAQPLLFNSGQYMNSPGTGAGGADESVLQTTSLSMGSLGFGFQKTAPNRIADDFTLSSSSNITRFEFFAYQTLSGNTSTITEINFQIWNGNPGVPGSTVVWGDQTTNRLTSTSWTNVYRITETTTGNTQRPIMRCICDVNINLAPGTYWVDVQADGSSPSGPWCPPVTINGQSTTGNAVQFFTGAWSNLVDGSTSTQQGMPFNVYGTGATAVPISPWSIIVAFMLMIGFVGIRLYRMKINKA